MSQRFDLLSQIEAADGKMTKEVQQLLTLKENEIETTTQFILVASYAAGVWTSGVEFRQGGTGHKGNGLVSSLLPL